jgi:electron transport complex protein RnfD
LRRNVTITSGASVITGLLVGMNVPPDIPVWIPALGSVFAVVIVRELYGGIGHNIFNPALAGRAFMMASWPVYMTSFRNMTLPGNSPAISETIPKEIFDVITRATPLTAMKDGTILARELNVPVEAIYDSLMNKTVLKVLLIGNTGGCIGEASAALILAGALVLLWRKIITWHIPLTFIGTVASAFYIYYYYKGLPHPGYLTMNQVFSGGLILGAFFMATDMVTSPLSGRGMLLFGFGCGLITFIIRLMGGYPEGVCYAILIMNSLVPLIDRITKPSIFGYSRNSARKEKM